MKAEKKKEIRIEKKKEIKNEMKNEKKKEIKNEMKNEMKNEIELSKEFFYDEVRDGFYIPGIVKRLWGAGLRILSEIDRICTRHRIPYYAAAGTLLGAVRSGEFIPGTTT